MSEQGDADCAFATQSMRNGVKFRFNIESHSAFNPSNAGVKGVRASFAASNLGSEGP